MSNDFFRFKQFTVKQGGAAMKVGVDSVLLGAWTSADCPARVLDVGTGTGLLALMLAQRYPDAMIDAVEIDYDAYCQALENIASSPWSSRIRIICNDFRDYAEHTSLHYDLIVSNPPYFTASLKPADARRNVARHNDSLPHRHLLTGAETLLAPAGILAVVLPPAEASALMSEAVGRGLLARRMLYVQSRPSKPAYRTLMELSKTTCLPEEKTLCIEQADQSDFTDEYRCLTKEFYLKF